MPLNKEPESELDAFIHFGRFLIKTTVSTGRPRTSKILARSFTLRERERKRGGEIEGEVYNCFK